MTSRRIVDADLISRFSNVDSQKCAREKLGLRRFFVSALRLLQDIRSMIMGKPAYRVLMGSVGEYDVSVEGAARRALFLDGPHFSVE